MWSILRIASIILERTAFFCNSKENYLWYIYANYSAWFWITSAFIRVHFYKTKYMKKCWLRRMKCTSVLINNLEVYSKWYKNVLLSIPNVRHQAVYVKLVYIFIFLKFSSTEHLLFQNCETLSFKTKNSFLNVNHVHISKFLACNRY